MTRKEITDMLRRVAEECSERGPGYAQQSVAVREAAKRLDIGSDLATQQELLTCWHELFRSGVLAWGYDLDNPGPPWFHFAEETMVGNKAQ